MHRDAGIDLAGFRLPCTAACLLAMKVLQQNLKNAAHGPMRQKRRMSPAVTGRGLQQDETRPVLPKNHAGGALNISQRSM